MRNWLMLMLGVAACGKSTASTVSGEAANEAATKAELVALEHEWAKALEAHDTAFFERTFAADFIATSGDNTTGRAAMIKEVSDTGMTFMNVGDEDQLVRLYAGGKLGVVTGRVNGTIRVGQQKLAQVARYTEVFEKRNDRWQAIAAHYSSVTPTTTVSDVERRRIEDSTKAWIAMTFRQSEQADSAGLMDSYVPSGPVASAYNGELITSRDSLEQSYAGLKEVTGTKATYHDVKIDVLAPGVAAATMLVRHEGVYKGKKFIKRGVYTVVLAEREGRLRLIQESGSTVRPPKE
jgi:ketosteroid isomerase-like protein